MSDDQTPPVEPESPAAPQPAQPAYAMPLPAGYPAYAAAQRPRFADQVMGMRAVVATSLACLVVGGLGGFVLGRATGDDHNGFGRTPGGFLQHGGAFPNRPGFGQAPNGQAPNGQAPNGQAPHGQAPHGQSNQQFGQGQSGR